jgi:hypothetical protein
MAASPPDRLSPLFFLVALAASAALAALASLPAPGRDGATLLANGVYFTGFATCCALVRAPRHAYHAEFLTAFLLFAILATTAFLCGMASETGGSLLPVLLRRPLEAVGYVSSAPDSWPPLLAAMWMATVLPVTLAALLAGRAASRLRARLGGASE